MSENKSVKKVDNPAVAKDKKEEAKGVLAPQRNVEDVLKELSVVKGQLVKAQGEAAGFKKQLEESNAKNLNLVSVFKDALEQVSDGLSTIDNSTRMITRHIGKFNAEGKK